MKYYGMVIENHGSIVLIRPKRELARKWLEQNTDGQWFGGALAVEPRYIADLVQGATEAGFNVKGS